MKIFFKNRFFGFIIICIILLCLSACPKPGSDSDNEYLIRVGNNILTVFEFNRAFEITKTAYPHNEMQNSAVLRSAQLRLLNQKTEELVLIERANELQIIISDEDLDSAVSDIKKDYPDDVFEEILLENAISFNSWKEELKIRLIIEKVIKVELEDKITIVADEIKLFYSKYYQARVEGPEGPESESQSKKINDQIIRHLRKKKAEENYNDWINGLIKQYKIEINQEQWEKMIE